MIWRWGRRRFWWRLVGSWGMPVVAAWDVHGSPVDLPDAIAPVEYARRLVAQRCLYGVG